MSKPCSELNRNGQVCYGVWSVDKAAPALVVRDPACPAPQVFQFKPVLWANGKVQELPTVHGDLEGVAFGINDNSQMVGGSGNCTTFNPNTQIYLLPSHALLWQNGTMTDLGNFGGTGQFGGNLAFAVNNQGQVVGNSDLHGDTTFHAFLWTRETGMQDLGTFPGDFASVALGITDRGEVVGTSLDANFNLWAVLWEYGVPVDLNSVIPANSGLYLQLAHSINSRGQIVGFAQTSTGDTHAFLATRLTAQRAVRARSFANSGMLVPMILES